MIMNSKKSTILLIAVVILLFVFNGLSSGQAHKINFVIPANNEDGLIFSNQILVANTNVIEIECIDYKEGMIAITPADDKLEGLQIAYLNDGKVSIAINDKSEYKLGLSIVNPNDKSISVTLKVKGIKIK